MRPTSAPLLRIRSKSNTSNSSKSAVYKFGSADYLQLRDWSLNPGLLLDAQDIYHAATVEAYPTGEKVILRPDPYDEPTPTYVGNHIMAARSDWLSRHLNKSAEAGIHPTRSPEAVSHLALRKNFSSLSLKSTSCPTRHPRFVYGDRISRRRPCQQLYARNAGNFVIQSNISAFIG